MFSFKSARVWVSNILSYQVARSDLFVPNGASATRVLKDLAPNLSVTERKFLFFLYPFFSHVQAGFYRFPRASSVIEALKSINDGNAVVNRVTVPEGITSALLFEQLGGLPECQAIQRGGQSRVPRPARCATAGARRSI